MSICFKKKTGLVEIVVVFSTNLKLVNIEKEDLHIYRTTGVISMKFSGKMCLMIILKVKKTEVDLLSRKHNFGKTTRVFLGLKNRDYKQNI